MSAILKFKTFVFFILVWTLHAQTLISSIQQFCETGSPCTVGNVNFLNQQSFVVPSSGVVNTARYGTGYRVALRQLNMIRNNFVLFSSGSAVDCSGSRAFIFESSAPIGAKALANVEWENRNDFACNINFTLKVSSVSMNKQFLDLVLAVDPKITVPLNIAFQEPIRPGVMPLHFWNVATDTSLYSPNFRPIKVTLNVQQPSGLKFVTPETCDPISALVRQNSRLVLYRQDGVVFEPNCKVFPTTSVMTSSNSYRNEYIMPMQQYFACSLWTFSNGNFTLPMSAQLELHPSCTYVEELEYPRFNFNVRVSNSLNTWHII